MDLEMSEPYVAPRPARAGPFRWYPHRLCPDRCCLKRRNVQCHQWHAHDAEAPAKSALGYARDQHGCGGRDVEEWLFDGSVLRADSRAAS